MLLDVFLFVLGAPGYICIVGAPGYISICTIAYLFLLSFVASAPVTGVGQSGNTQSKLPQYCLKIFLQVLKYLYIGLFHYYELHLEGIDGSLTRLGDTRGFRELVKAKAIECNITGTIQRTHGRDAILIFEGTVTNTIEFIKFLKQCRSQAMIRNFVRPNPQITEDTWYGDFTILTSRSKRATRGQYSSHEYDKLSEYSYGDQEMLFNHQMFIMMKTFNCYE